MHQRQECSGAFGNSAPLLAYCSPLNLALPPSAALPFFLNIPSITICIRHLSPSVDPFGSNLNVSMSLNDCPVEILALIVAHADIKLLRVLRVVNTMLHDLATPAAFTRMQFTNNMASCYMLRCFVKLYDYLATYITTLVFRWTLPASISASGLIERHIRRSNVTGVGILAALDQFPALVDLILGFSPDPHKLSVPYLSDTEVEVGQSATEAQFCMLSALTGENGWIPRLKSLKLPNLIPMDAVYSGRDRWAKVLETLEKLDISVHGTGAFVQEHSELFWNRMWQWSIPNRPLRPLQRQLASLTLTSDQPVRHLDLRDLHFPALRHLGLGGIVFDNESDCPVQCFILRHGGCLSSLILDSCPMFIPESVTTTRARSLRKGTTVL
ncbi:hypothetical protein C8Q78DRAFT_285447 [Trametes maxima]|nr:hypothetical protein C8Q78DRAFT_285447 [Trametes maxima]